MQQCLATSGTMKSSKLIETLESNLSFRRRRELVIWALFTFLS